LKFGKTAPRKRNASPSISLGPWGQLTLQPILLLACEISRSPGKIGIGAHPFGGEILEEISDGSAEGVGPQLRCGSLGNDDWLVLRDTCRAGGQCICEAAKGQCKS
jgi:hypothetical protein